MNKTISICSFFIVMSPVGCGTSINHGLVSSSVASGGSLSSEPSTPVGRATGDCWAHTTESDCVADYGCMAITGARVLKQNDCVGPETFLACEPQRGCSREIVHASDPSGRLWRFRRTCWPVGWKDGYFDSAIRECGKPSPCHGLSETECIDNDLCKPLTATIIDPSSGCLAAAGGFVACREQGPCGLSITCAADPAGRIRGFGTTCIPRGWPTLACPGRCGGPRSQIRNPAAEPGRTAMSSQRLVLSQ